ncbi:hypothetical protein C8R44DRAFT_648237, partial [Mycena epipterygia]
PAGCNCASRTTYNGTDIQAACDQALTLASEGKTVGNDKYPHVYNGEFVCVFHYAQLTVYPRLRKVQLWQRAEVVLRGSYPAHRIHST